MNTDIVIALFVGSILLCPIFIIALYEGVENNQKRSTYIECLSIIKSSSTSSDSCKFILEK